jgi:hypothetical protein
LTGAHRLLLSRSQRPTHQPRLVGVVGPKRDAGASALALTKMENWKDIPGYECRYQVSDYGRVRSFRRDIQGRFLKPGRMPGGHLSVALGRGNSQCVHKLVLLAFVGAPYAGRECLHRNGVPGDNRLVNLHWGTRSENMTDAYAHGARDREKNCVALSKGRATRWGHA